MIYYMSVVSKWLIMAENICMYLILTPVLGESFDDSEGFYLIDDLTNGSGSISVLQNL